MNIRETRLISIIQKKWKMKNKWISTFVGVNILCHVSSRFSLHVIFVILFALFLLTAEKLKTVNFYFHAWRSWPSWGVRKRREKTHELGSGKLWKFLIWFHYEELHAATYAMFIWEISCRLRVNELFLVFFGLQKFSTRVCFIVENLDSICWVIELFIGLSVLLITWCFWKLHI